MKRKLLTKSLPALALALSAIAAHAAKPQIFSIEPDDGFGAVPAEIEVLLSHVRAADDHCHLIGKPVQLAPGGKVPGLLVKTADGGGWGSAMGPVWLVRTGNKPQLVLDQGGTSLQLGPAVRHGLYEVILEEGNAGSSITNYWSYNGRKYAMRKRVVHW